MICCCTGGAAQQLVVVCFDRQSFSGTQKSVIALDGTGTEVWHYDLGLDSASNPFFGGRPSIDSSGNVYIPYMGVLTTGFTPTCASGMVKLDKTGALVWNYSVSGTITLSSTGFGSTVIFDMMNTSFFDSSGNIVFTIAGRRGSDGAFAIKLNTSGSVVTTYTDSGYPAITVAGINGTKSLAIDSSDNLLFITGDSARRTLIKTNSAGTYQSKFNPTPSSAGTGHGLDAGISGLAIDAANGKVYACHRTGLSPGGGYDTSGTTTVLCSKNDISGMSTDWTFTLANLNTTIVEFGTASTLTNQNGLAYNSTFINFAAGNLMRNDQMPEIQYIGFQSSSGAGSPTNNWSLDVDSAHSAFGVDICCDQTTGDLFAIILNSTSAIKCAWKVGGGGTSWSAISNGATAVHPNAIGASSYT